MQSQVAGNGTWSKYSTCLYEARTCGDVREYIRDKLKAQQLSPLEAGCCLPPEGCVFNGADLSSPSFFSFAFDMPTAPKVSTAPAARPPAFTSVNCSTFSLDPSQMCYGCSYCQGGLLSELRGSLRLEAYICLGIFVAMFMLVLLSCFAYCGSRGEDKEKKGKDDNVGVGMTRQETIIVTDPSQVGQLTSVPTFKRSLTFGADGALASNPQLARTLTRVQQALDNDVKTYNRTITFVGPSEPSNGGGYSRTDTFQAPAPGPVRSNTFNRGSEYSPVRDEHEYPDTRHERRQYHDYDEESGRGSDDRSEVYDDDLYD
eukprot:TRINITY_DN70619_c0_g1_i1.p1 TRINITY_DN70619_c0_g1~~TRINITY_DN70619_c0_g1_i1.p1  ORF type:complete len:316 (-),score=14.91 TRINITY_DN70619_c0_g1_i1:118-1065(-)